MNSFFAKPSRISFKRSYFGNLSHTSHSAWFMDPWPLGMIVLVGSESVSCEKEYMVVDLELGINMI